MSNITYKTGDLMLFTEDAFGHGCNCQSTMGSGVAKAVKEHFPELYKADIESKRRPQFKLGHFTKAQLSNGMIGYNIYSQFSYTGRKVGKMDLDYLALELGLFSVLEDMEINGLESLALPKVGAGLAGGDWKTIENIIKDVSSVFSTKIVIYTL